MLFCYSSELRGVSGNAEKGCNSIVVSKQDKSIAELDCFVTLAYVTTIKQGANALLKSFEGKLPVRVIRSSRLKGPFAAPKPAGEKGKGALYRYDGVYFIQSVTNQNGHDVTAPLPKDPNLKYTFLLDRASPTMDGNEFWTATHLSNCMQFNTIGDSWQVLYLRDRLGRETTRSWKVRTLNLRRILHQKTN